VFTARGRSEVPVPSGTFFARGAARFIPPQGHFKKQRIGVKTRRGVGDAVSLSKVVGFRNGSP